MIPVTVESFKFTPNVIKFKKGQKAILKLTGITGAHGFMVPDMNINETISADEQKMVSIPTDKPGEFNFLCSVPCGPGHKDMTGKIIIE